MENLEIKKAWEGDGFFEIEIYAQSACVGVRARSYTTVELINELASYLALFPDSNEVGYVWQNGTRGDSSTQFVSLEAFCEDELGHVALEAYIEIDDGASLDRHNCCFYIRTELGALNRFGRALPLLNRTGIGQKVALWPDDGEMG